jgi:hypothetical protein
MIQELMELNMTTESRNYIDKAWKTGMIRVNKIMDDERFNGFTAWATGSYSNLRDILIIDNDATLSSGNTIDPIVRVYEVTNYARPDEYVRMDRAERYKNTLLQFKGEKIFVCSYEQNLNQIPNGRKYFEDVGIEVRVMGYQDK